MAKSIIVDDSKVMDVSKPGKGKIVTTSRPVVAPVASDASKKTEDASPAMPDTEEVKPLAPSAAKKVIQPLTEDEKPAESASSSEAADGSSVQAESDQADNPEQETPKEETPAESKPADAAPEDSDAAGVDALAESVNSKKEAAKKAEEQAKKDAEVQALIDSKKYVVPIGHESPGSNNPAAKKQFGIVIAIVALLALISGYLLIDLGVFGSSIKLPYEFFKEDKNQTTVPVTQVDESQAQEESTEEALAEEAMMNSAAGTTAERDENRKNELKSLQQRLETYFDDNDSYPASLAGLEPSPTADETTGPGGDAYVYDPSANLQSYVLAANLENSNDPDAEANSTYVLMSVNQ